MANVKISALPAGTATGADEVPVNQAGTTRKITALGVSALSIEDTIVNGVTDKAPSQNAVFDALASQASVGIAGAIQFSDGSGAFDADNSNLYWDDSANVLTVSGAQSPNASGFEIIEVLTGTPATDTIKFKSKNRAVGSQAATVSYQSGDNATGTTLVTSDVTFRSGDIGSTSDGVSGSLSARSGDNANTSSTSATGDSTVRSGNHAGLGATGTLTTRGGNITNAASTAVSGAFTGRSGDSSGLGATGASTIRTGNITNTSSIATTGATSIITGAHSSTTVGASGTMSVTSGTGFITGTTTVRTGNATTTSGNSSVTTGTGVTSGNSSLSTGVGSTLSGNTSVSTGTGPATGSTNISTGNAATTTSGNINLTTGSAGTTRGSVLINSEIFSLKGTGSITQELRFNDAANSGNYVGFKAGAPSTTTMWALPDADGSSGQALVTDGAGILSFSTFSTFNPASITSDLIPATDATRKNGTSAKNWLEVWSNSLFSSGTLALASNASGDITITSDQLTTILSVADVDITASSGHILLSAPADQIYMDTNSFVAVRAQNGSVGSIVNIYDADSSAYVALKAPDVVTGSYAIELPPAQGAADQVLVNDGSGILSWENRDGWLDPIVLTNTDFTDVAAVQTISIATVPVGYMLEKIIVRPTVAFASPLATAITIDIGIDAGGLRARYVEALDIFGAPNSSTGAVGIANEVMDFVSDVDVAATLAITDDTLDQMTDGSVTVYIKISKYVQ